MLLKLQQILRYQSGMSDADWQLFRFLWKTSKPQTYETVHSLSPRREERVTQTRSPGAQVTDYGVLNCETESEARARRLAEMREHML